MSESQKTALVTGGAGFIGTHLCARLLQDGYRVISLDNYFTGSKENHIDGVDYREGHTKDIAEHIPEKVDIIFHLGEYARVEQSVLEPELVYDLNTEGTAGVIAFWRTRKSKLVYAGSSTKFGDDGKTRVSSPYAKTKAENSERVCEVGELEQLPYAVTYFYNVYGPGERTGVYGTVIEHFKRMYRSGAPCALVAPGTQVRNFTHVLDIVDALVLVGESGSGDEYGLGCEVSYSIREVADMFGFQEENIVLFPERPGNRMGSTLDTTKIRALGWEARRSLLEYIQEYTNIQERGEPLPKRVLVFATTFAPISGLAEDACVDLAQKLPSVHFDVVTTRFSKNYVEQADMPGNVSVHRVGFGYRADKFLLPVLGALKARTLTREYSYLFMWSLMASYAALAAIAAKIFIRRPLLVTLADQQLSSYGALRRFFLAHAVGRSDQVYGTSSLQERDAMRISRKTLPRNTLGEGDAFANALRFAYADIVRKVC